MSPRWSASNRGPTSATSWGGGLLLCMALTGCQLVPIRTGQHTVTEASGSPTQFVADSTARLPVVRQTSARSRDEHRVLQSSFESQLWQSEEPTPLLNADARWCSEFSSPEEDVESECLQPCFGCDLECAMPSLWADTQGVVNWNNGLILAGAGGLALWFREGGLDQDVRDEVAESPLRWGEGSRFLGRVGDVRYQAPVLLGLYGYSIWSQDEELHDVMGSVISASVITGVSTVALKVVANTDRPSDKWMNGHYGFPSHHTASTFAIAAVLDEYYGGKVGLPAYLVAGAVGFSRLDEQDHDLSDVVFGGALGFVIGKAVAGRHLCGNSKISLMPYFHPTDGTPGLAFEQKF